MSLKIQSIETRYKGCLFRSRLEARWAIFFDNLYIPWEYEKEGYKLESGWYLPDFWLPSHNCFFEVKGEKPSDAEYKKAVELSSATQKVVAIASGTMRIDGLDACFDETEDESEHTRWMPCSSYNMNAFAGEAWETWDTSPLDMTWWNWTVEEDLSRYLAGLGLLQLENLDLRTEEARKKVIQADIDYYFAKCGKELKRWKNGRSLDVSWKDDQSMGARLVFGAAEGGGNKVYAAMNAARSARF